MTIDTSEPKHDASDGHINTGPETYTEGEANEWVAIRRDEAEAWIRMPHTHCIPEGEWK